MAGAKRDDLDASLSGLAEGLQPVEADNLADHLTMMWTLFMASRQTADPDALSIWLGMHLRLLGDLPQDIAAHAIDRAVQTSAHGFMPSIGEIRSIAEPLLVERWGQFHRLTALVAHVESTQPAPAPAREVAP